MRSRCPHPPHLTTHPLFRLRASHSRVVGDWSGSLAAILDIAHRLEVDARDLFSEAAGKTDLPEVRKIFEQLSRFEEGHMKLIDDMRRQYL